MLYQHVLIDNAINTNSDYHCSSKIFGLGDKTIIVVAHFTICENIGTRSALTMSIRLLY